MRLVWSSYLPKILNSALLSLASLTGYGALAGISQVALAAVSERSGDVSFSELQEQIRIKKVSWRAGRTSHSDWHISEKKALLGAPLSEVRTDGDYGKSSRVWEDALPETFDWRDYEGTNYVSPVRDQGRCGSCVAFAMGSTYETQLNIATRSAGRVWSFSPQHLFSCGGGSCSMGWFPVSAVDYLAKKGLPEEACFPYVSGAVGSDVACKLSCSDSRSRSVKGLLRVKSKGMRASAVDEVKKALLSGPLMTTMKVYADFYHYTGGVYRHQKGAMLGGHAVMIVGWRNEDRAWIVRNSWGSGWGEQGDFRIAWDDPSGVGGLFYGVQPADDFSGIFLQGLADERTLRQPAELSVRSEKLSFISASLEIRGNSGQSLVSKPFSSDGKLVFDPREFQDGVYTIQARAVLSDGTQRISQARIVFVRNGPASASIKIDRMKSGMNIWEKVIPHFVVTSSPVPLAKVRYKIVSAKGAIVRVRSTDHTADRVALTLNPEGLELGRYQLVAEAVSDEEEVLASDSLEFNITEK
ncbi:MAG: hypothetical protein RL189_1581 [Pseudomonadota bacterium]